MIRENVLAVDAGRVQVETLLFQPLGQLEVLDAVGTVTENPVPVVEGERRPGDCTALVSGSTLAGTDGVVDSMESLESLTELGVRCDVVLRKIFVRRWPDG